MTCFQPCHDKGFGRSGASGPGVSLEIQEFAHSKVKVYQLRYSELDQPCHLVVDNVNPPKNITIDHCYSKIIITLPKLETAALVG